MPGTSGKRNSEERLRVRLAVAWGLGQGEAQTTFYTRHTLQSVSRESAGFALSRHQNCAGSPSVAGPSLAGVQRQAALSILLDPGCAETWLPLGEASAIPGYALSS